MTVGSLDVDGVLEELPGTVDDGSVGGVLVLVEVDDGSLELVELVGSDELVLLDVSGTEDVVLDVVDVVVVLSSVVDVLVDVVVLDDVVSSGSVVVVVVVSYFCSLHRSTWLMSCSCPF